MRELEAIRAEIDRVDAQLAEAFLHRMELAREVGRYKREAGRPVYDPQREAALLQDRAARYGGGQEAGEEQIRRFFRSLMDQSRALQEKGNEE